MLRNQAGGGEDGEERGGLGRGVWAAGSTEMENIEKPAARLGCVGGNGWGLAIKLFMAQRLLCVHAM